MRTAITRAVNEINAQYKIQEGAIVAKEYERGVEIRLPATKRFIHIPPYTSKQNIKTLIRIALKDEKGFQEIMDKSKRDAKQRTIFQVIKEQRQ